MQGYLCLYSWDKLCP